MKIWKNSKWKQKVYIARCILHENDHLDGIVYVDKVEGKLYDNSELYPEEEQ